MSFDPTLFKNPDGSLKQTDMLIVQAFNQMLNDFIDDLAETCPDNMALREGKVFLEGAMVMSPKTPLERWKRTMEGHEDMIRNLDTPDGEAYFLAHAPQMDYINELDIPTYWPLFGEEEKACVKEHIQWLSTVAKTIDNMDDGLMKELSNLANKVAARFKDADPRSLDFNAIGRSVMAEVMSNKSFQAAVKQSEKSFDEDNVYGLPPNISPEQVQQFMAQNANSSADPSAIQAQLARMGLGAD